MDAKKHKELFDLMLHKSSYYGFVNYKILVCLLKKFSCYDDFLDNVDIERIIKKNNFDTNAYILGLSFCWRDSDKGDVFWRTINLIYISLILLDEKKRQQLYWNYKFYSKYKFAKSSEIEYLSLIYYFGIENGERLFYWLTKTCRCLPEVNGSENYFNKNINIISKMIKFKFIKNSEFLNFLYTNGIYN